jgi:hypothetical protein
VGFGVSVKAEAGWMGRNASEPVGTELTMRRGRRGDMNACQVSNYTEIECRNRWMNEQMNVGDGRNEGRNEGRR